MKPNNTQQQEPANENSSFSNLEADEETKMTIHSNPKGIHRDFKVEGIITSINPDPELAELETFLAETPKSTPSQAPTEIDWETKTNSGHSPLDFLNSLFSDWPNFSLEHDIIESVLKTSRTIDEAISFLLEMAMQSQSEEQEPNSTVSEDAFATNQALEEQMNEEDFLAWQQLNEQQEAQNVANKKKKKEKRRLVQKRIPKEEAIRNLSEIFPQVEHSSIEAVLISVDFDLQLAFNYLQLNAPAIEPTDPAQIFKKPNKKFVKRNDLIGGGEITWTGNLNEDFLDKFSASNIQRAVPHVSKDAINYAIKKSKHSIGASSSSSNSQQQSYDVSVGFTDLELVENLKKAYPKMKVEIVSADSNSVKKFVPNYYHSNNNNNSNDDDDDDEILWVEDNNNNNQNESEIDRFSNEDRIEKTKEYFETMKKLTQKSGTIRDEFFKLSVIEYMNGNVDKASELAKKGKQANSIHEHYSTKFKKDSENFGGFEKKFENNMKFNPLFTIDFHGYLVADAIQALERHLLLVKSLRISKLTIITGKGAHSVGGKSKLKPAVIEFLSKKMNQGDLDFNVKIFEGGVKVFFHWRVK